MSQEEKNLQETLPTGESKLTDLEFRQKYANAEYASIPEKGKSWSETFKDIGRAIYG